MMQYPAYFIRRRGFILTLPVLAPPAAHEEAFALAV